MTRPARTRRGQGKPLDLSSTSLIPPSRRTPPASSAATILFVSPIGPTPSPPPRGSARRAPPSIFLAVARGILYAINEDGGTFPGLLRVGTDITDFPTVARGSSPPARPTSRSSPRTSPASPRSRRTLRGPLPWYQPPGPQSEEADEMLSVAAAGPPVVVGSRVFVPLRDEQARSSSLTQRPARAAAEFASASRWGRTRFPSGREPGFIPRRMPGRVYVIDVMPATRTAIPFRCGACR